MVKIKINFDSSYLCKDDLFYVSNEEKYVIYKQHWLNHIKRIFSFLPIKFKYKYYLKDE